MCVCWYYIVKSCRELAGSLQDIQSEIEVRKILHLCPEMPYDVIYVCVLPCQYWTCNSQRELESALGRMCANFHQHQYEQIQAAYTILGRTQVCTDLSYLQLSWRHTQCTILQLLLIVCCCFLEGRI